MNGQPIVPGKKQVVKSYIWVLMGVNINGFVINQPHLVVNGSIWQEVKNQSQANSRIALF